MNVSQSSAAKEKEYQQRELKNLRARFEDDINKALNAEIDTESIKAAFQAALRCKHHPCDGQRHNIMVVDDHDGSVGTYYLTSFCSLECFVCHLKHEADSDHNLAEFVEKEVWV